MNWKNNKNTDFYNFFVWIPTENAYLQQVFIKSKNCVSGSFVIQVFVQSFMFKIAQKKNF